MSTLKGSCLAVCLILIAMAEAEDSVKAIGNVTSGINQFSSSLFTPLVENNHDNFMISALSAAVNLASIAYGSVGETKNQFKSVLHLPTPDSVGASGYQLLIDDMSHVQYNQLVLANKIFVEEEATIKPNYQELLRTYFRSEIQAINFAEPNEAANIINKWIQNYAKDHPGHLTDLVTSNDLSSSMGLVLVNALYFKGQWKNKFDPSSTTEMSFHINEDRHKMVPTMYRRGVYSCGELENRSAKFIVLPFKEDELSMVIIVPNEIDGLPDLEKHLESTSIEDILKRGRSKMVQLYLPKFKFHTKVDLKSSLNRLGLTDMFTTNANFYGISDNKLIVSKVIQNIFVSVDEEGGDADAESGNVAISDSEKVTGRSMNTFSVNQPFYFTIIKTVNNVGKQLSPIVTIHSGQVIEPHV